MKSPSFQSKFNEVSKYTCFHIKSTEREIFIKTQTPFEVQTLTLGGCLREISFRAK